MSNDRCARRDARGARSGASLFARCGGLAACRRTIRDGFMLGASERRVNALRPAAGPGGRPQPRPKLGFRPSRLRPDLPHPGDPPRPRYNCCVQDRLPGTLAARKRCCSAWFPGVVEHGGTPVGAVSQNLTRRARATRPVSGCGDAAGRTLRGPLGSARYGPRRGCGRRVLRTLAYRPTRSGPAPPGGAVGLETARYDRTRGWRATYGTRSIRTDRSPCGVNKRTK